MICVIILRSLGSLELDLMNSLTIFKDLLTTLDFVDNVKMSPHCRAAWWESIVDIVSTDD